MTNLLKSIELQGYKTFASRHVFDFTGSITAIVGPNGSGKSNIVDAIRWVLGEQSYSLLRGKRTEDMIFSGSEGRSRAGMAEATVLLDNSDGWLPIDFSEVAITRRAYRDGQNEYLLNHQKVRLKDVGELLSQSGLAERTYTIIGQGLVDAALSLRADERRKLFEEAAGIGLYRSRREEALRRLETTQRNLDRVMDILAELRPRLRSLERQARRAKEYEQIQSDLRVILAEWYGYHWHYSQRELVKAREQADSQEQALERLRSEQEAAEGEYNHLRDEINTLRSRINAWHRQLAELHTQRDSLGRQLAVADERTRSLQQQDADIGEEMQRLQEEQALQDSRLKVVHQTLARRQEELDSAAGQKSSAEAKLADRQAERDRVNRQLAEVSRSRSNLAAEQNQIEARNAQRIEQQAQFEAQIAEADAALEAAAEQRRTQQKSLEQAEQKMAGLQEAQAAAAAAWQQHESERQTIEQQKQEQTDQLAEARTTQTRLKTQLDVLEQAEKSLVGYAEGTRVLLEAARNKNLIGAAGALSSRIEVPAEYEAAVAAALGEFLDAVLLEGPVDSDSALDIIEKAQVPGALLPYTAVRSAEPARIKNTAGVIGVASAFVNAPAELRPAVDLLLGNVILVEDRKSARAVLAGQPPGVRAVTLRGEVFYESGMITTSQLDQKAASNSGLGRTRQRRELEQSLTSNQEKIEANQSRLEALNQRISQHQVAGDELAAELQKVEQDIREFRQSLESLRISHDRSQEHIDWYQDRKNQLEKDLANNQAAVDSDRQRLVVIEEELAALQQHERTLKHGLLDLPDEDYQQQLNHWQTQQIVAQEAVSSLESRLQEGKRQEERLQANLNHLLDRQRRIAAELSELEATRQTLRQQNQGVHKEIEVIQALVTPAEAELDALEKNFDSYQQSENRLRKALSSAEHHHAQARIRLNKQLDALDSMRRRIEDDFGLVEFDYEAEVSGPTPLPLSGMVEKLPYVEEIAPDLEDSLKRKRAQLRRMGAINPEARQEYQDVHQRFEFMTSQVTDLEKAEVDIRQVISELDALMQQEFQKTFTSVAAEFKDIFTRLFGGGSAALILTDPEDITNTGIDIEARLPGRRVQGLSLLSGGERSLTATALVFALLKTSPTPFCVLDEVDAMLDEANVGRFRELLKELSHNTQFIIITHNRNTVQAADVIYGVTMGRDSTSRVLSLRLDQVAELTEAS